MKVRLPASLSSDARGGMVVVDADPATVGALLDRLDGRFPGLKHKVLDERGELRRYVNVFVNGADVRYEGGMARELSDDDEVLIVPAIAGGRAR